MVTRVAGRVLGAVALVLTTAALGNSFIDRLHATRLDKSDAWYLASQTEKYVSYTYLFYALVGAAFVLAAGLKEQPMRDDQLLPPSRPRWLAWPLAILAISVICLTALGLPAQLEHAARQGVPLAHVMTVAAALGILGLLSPVPVLRHLAWLAVSFASFVAVTAWGALEVLLYAERVPDLTRSNLSDPTHQVLVLHADESQQILRVMNETLSLYESFFLLLAIGLGLVWLHYALRRVPRQDSAKQFQA